MLRLRAVPEPTQDMSEVVGSVTLTVSSAGSAVMPATLQTLQTSGDRHDTVPMSN